MAGGRATSDRASGSPGRPRRAPLVVTLAMLIALAAIALPSFPATEAAWGATVAAEAANLRSEPGTWAEVVGSVYMGQWVEIAAGPSEDNWYQVASGGQFGWILGDFLTFEGGGGGAVAAVAAAPSGVGGGGYPAWVDTDALNVRAEAGTGAAVKDQIAQGGAMTVVGDAVGGFLPIEYGGGRGWVSAAYLRYDGPPVATAGGGGGGSGGGRWIDVDRGSQRVTLFEGDAAVASYWGAFGYDDSADGFYATAIGTYYVYSKAQGLNWTEYGQAYITDWVGFDPSRANGFHSFSRNANGNVLANGAAPTGGCVATEPAAAAHIFAFAEMGMRVEVHW